MALIASLSVCNTKSLYGLCVSVIVCLLCTVGYIHQYEPLSMEAECWACCGEINDRGRWQIVESEISLMQKSPQQHRPYMPSYKNMHWIRGGEKSLQLL